MDQDATDKPTPPHTRGRLSGLRAWNQHHAVLGAVLGSIVGGVAIAVLLGLKHPEDFTFVFWLQRFLTYTLIVGLITVTQAWFRTRKAR